VEEIGRSVLLSFYYLILLLKKDGNIKKKNHIINALLCFVTYQRYGQQTTSIEKRREDGLIDYLFMKTSSTRE